MLHRGTSKFQTVEVVKTVPFGSLLITDGLMQSSEVDEYVYHQSLVHPALTAHPDPLLHDAWRAASCHFAAGHAEQPLAGVPEGRSLQAWLLAHELPAGQCGWCGWCG